MMIFNETFKPFLNELSSWVAGGCKEDDRFQTSSGICYNYEVYLKDKCYSSYEAFDACRGLNRLFKSEGLNPLYPFNHTDYYIEVMNWTIFENKNG